MPSTTENENNLENGKVNEKKQTTLFKFFKGDQKNQNKTRPLNDLTNKQSSVSKSCQVNQQKGKSSAKGECSSAQNKLTKVKSEGVRKTSSKKITIKHQSLQKETTETSLQRSFSSQPIKETFKRSLDFTTKDKEQHVIQTRIKMRGSSSSDIFRSKITQTPGKTKYKLQQQSSTSSTSDEVQITVEHGSDKPVDATPFGSNSSQNEAVQVMDSFTSSETSNENEDDSDLGVIGSSPDDNQRIPNDPSPDPEPSENNHDRPAVQSGPTNLPRSFNSSDFRTYNDGGILGYGGYSTVRIAFHDALEVVAVKCIDCPRNNTTIANKISQEMDLLRLGRNPNVISLLGVIAWDHSIGIITEYMHGGNLQNLFVNNTIQIRPGLILRMLWEAAKGVSYLHYANADQGIIHGDLKPDNFMLTSGLHVKIGDFGGARLKSLTGSNRPNVSGGESTLQYRAPERLVNYNNMTKASDVYSFAMCIYVGLSRSAIPAPGNRREFEASVLNEDRPLLTSVDEQIRRFDELGEEASSSIVSSMKEILIQAWSNEPDDRPTMVQVRNRMEEILKFQDISSISQHAADVAKEMSFDFLPSPGNRPCVCIDQFQQSS
uniref:calmodulin-binding receptor-like cytoplasmic kinase 3 n=1 Tax=Ciona intestinalis TaxID=7719 RepID=UPI000EF54C2F|nr:calmodulin-binding receptor-like cytoplasmic kinase 3 [Ciona intestinalis]|eukprot:XP_018668805.2 calmodulin-binding receptor-like cytoplasmic kinase 3 [Ciona intestinalis]